MGTRQLNRLSARTIASKQEPGLYCDGGGLYLQIAPSGSKTWIFRYRSPLTRKLRDMGLGPLHSVALSEAREKAGAQRAALKSGLDPIAAKEEGTRRKAVEAAKVLTFSQCAVAYIDSHKAGWKSSKHADQWTNTIKTYAGPVIGALPVQDVDTGLVLQVLEPIWSEKAETASRLRGRIECILDWAKARGYRSGENPARWKGHLNQLLPTLSKKHRVKHHKAMPFSEVGAFVARLRELSSVAARCLEFTILTAARTGEAIQAKPGEFDLNNATWTVPASRMKAKKEHRVPLSGRAVEIVREMLKLEQEFVFPSTHRGEPISNMTMLALLDRMEVDATVHGFRSSFRDWAAERTAFPHEVCEMALAHTIPNAAEAAYRRGDLFQKRAGLMKAWAEFLAAPPQAGEVIPLKSAA
ncbi:MAG: integrase arm-type DNA-binding domain-containing protein [Betaproteobacteria bacterium]|nr:integrase arm-type DNA-binding domain-containing protein [Betaproteobacteria bacterium]